VHTLANLFKFKNLSEMMAPSDDEFMYMPSTSVLREEKGFFARHKEVIRRKFWAVGALASVYALSTMMTMLLEGTPIMSQSYDPRKMNEKVETVLKQDPSALHNLLNSNTTTSIIHGFYVATSWPYKHWIATMPDYDEALDKAFALAKIDPQNPNDDQKRFQFYRELGYAVNQNNDFKDVFCIAYKDLVAYVNAHDPTDQIHLKEEFVTPAKTWRILLGKTYFKADSRAAGGNEDGVVSSAEWNNALHKMGYATLDDVTDEAYAQLQGLDKTQFREKLEKLIQKNALNASFLKGTVPDLIPDSVLNAYLNLDVAQNIDHQIDF
jgi:hypothetical protein